MFKKQNAFQLLATFVFFLIGVTFLWYQFRYSIDAPLAPDDARMFLSHFMDKYVNENSFIEKIKYHFSVTNYPHAKLSGRFFSTLYYELTGSVSFKFLVILGSAILVFFGWLLRKTLDVSYFTLFPLAILLFTPASINQWIGPISGYPFLLVYSLTTFYLLSKGKFVLPAIIAFVCSFTHSPGIGIFLAAFPLFLIDPNRQWTKRISWLSMFIFTAFVYWATIISKSALVRSEDSREISDIVGCLPSMIAYEGQFLGLPILADRKLGGILQSNPILAAGLAFLVLAICLGIIWIRRKSFDPKFASLLAFLIFCMLPGPISAFVSDKCTTFNDLVAPRYMMYSMMAWTGFYVFLTSVIKPKFQIIAAIFFGALFLPRFINIYKRAPNHSNAMTYKWVKRATFNKLKITRPSENFSTLIKAKELGVFNARLPKFSKEVGEISNIEEGWDEFTYWLNINEYYCKLEILTKNPKDDIVEIWVSDKNDASRTERYIPKTNNQNYTRSTFFPTTADAPRELKRASIRAYYYVVENQGQCDSSLRFRQGNNLSSSLKKTQD